MNYDLFIPPAVLERAFVATAATGGANAGPVRLNPPGGAAGGSLGVAKTGLSQDARTQSYAEQLARTVAALNEVFDQTNVGLRYRVDDATGDTIVSVVNRDTGETIRQMPPDQIIRMRQRLQELMGVFFDATA